MKTHVLQFSDLREAQTALLCIFPFLYFISPMYVHTNNADHIAVLSLSATAALLLSATSLVMDISSFLRGTGQDHCSLLQKPQSKCVPVGLELYIPHYKQWFPQSQRRKMGMGERRKANCHFFLNHIPLNHWNFFNINTNRV